MQSGGTPEPRAGRADRLLPPQAGSNSRSGSFPGDGLRVTSPLSLCGEPRRAQVLPVLPYLHHGDAAVIARLSSGGTLGSLRRHTAQHTDHYPVRGRQSLALLFWGSRAEKSHHT
ncbi:hypothetical protein NQZ68_003722 [Dissostichus eleginoides]|nr:hypothetical protein NQZ68_003722 [Dissostichus eleginoides]